MLNMDLVEVPTKKPQRTSTFQVVSGRPMALDMTTIDHGDKSVLKTKSICRLHGDSLTYCVGSPGQSRPARFATAPGDGNTLVVLRRRTEK